MKTIITAINLTNRQHMRDIARGLAEVSPGLEIFIIENRFYYVDCNLDDFDIVITDRGEFKTYNPKVIGLEGRGTYNFDTDYGNNGQMLGKYATASEIFKTIVRTYERNNNLAFSSEAADNMQIVSLYSLIGGSGVSAAAVTIGRQISMATGKKVLYMNMGGSLQWKVYAYEAEEALRPVKELPHMIENNVLHSMDSYISTDKYGLKYLDRTEKAEIILDKLREMRIFDIVILDMPPRDLRVDFDKVCLIHNDQDVRAKYYSDGKPNFLKGKELIQIANRSMRADCEDGIIRIPEDRESFVAREKGIEILLDGNYAARIGKVWEKWI